MKMMLQRLIAENGCRKEVFSPTFSLLRFCDFVERALTKHTGSVMFHHFLLVWCKNLHSSKQQLYPSLRWQFESYNTIQYLFAIYDIYRWKKNEEN